MKSSLRKNFFRCQFSTRFSPERRRDDERWSFGYFHADECASLSKDFDLPYSTVLQKAKDAYPSIAVDQETLCGTPRIAGTRIPVYMVLDAVRYYGAIEGARKSYPQLTAEQVKDALAFASAVLEQPVEYELEALAR